MATVDEQQLQRAAMRATAKAWAISMGLLLGGTLFLATNILVVKGGDPVGPHLGLLGIYLPGYSVTFVGSLIGFVYAFVIGYIFGRMVTWLYRRVAALG